jgi:formamidopyrimidine-DNA glycosylase
VPELPEVETVVRDLRPLLEGRKLTRLETSGKRMRVAWVPDWEVDLAGRRVNQLRRRGKWIIFDLAGGSRLLIHLGMTGQLTVKPSRMPREPHTHLVASLDGGRYQLRFRDVRRFGCAAFFSDEMALAKFFVESGLGPEPFDLDAGYWRERLAGTNRCLKAVLLDQRVVAGVGNIYADEALHWARLHPALLGRSTNAVQARRLREGVIAVLNHAIDRRGSSIRDYIGGSGAKGQYQEEFRAYGRTGKPCTRCKTPIQRIRLAGRSTHFCPRCQREPTRS